LRVEENMARPGQENAAQRGGNGQRSAADAGSGADGKGRTEAGLAGRDRAREDWANQGGNSGAGATSRETALAFSTADGFPLTGTLFEGDGEGPSVLVSSATAVPQEFYAGFARALVKAGARAVLTYDYRATGRSPRPKGWRHRINFKDWSLLDFPAALAALEAVAPGHPLVGVGQSYGGHALGLSGVAERFQRYAMVASMTAWLGFLNDRAAWPRMNLVGVPVSLFSRDTPRWLGIGMPIPGSCFRDWARWCRMRNYFFDDPDLPETARFDAVRLPILAIGLTDDLWATPRGVGDYVARHPNAQLEERWISPQDGGGAAIGHLGFFRARFASTLWPPLIRWLLEDREMTFGRPRPPTG
jgi:predicted alpha/beta hydrolase